jgi:hypothetical protein
MEVAFTLTKTWSAAIAGRSTSCHSAPGAGFDFTTAFIFSGITSASFPHPMITWGTRRVEKGTKGGFQGAFVSCLYLSLFDRTNGSPRGQGR